MRWTNIAIDDLKKYNSYKRSVVNLCGRLEMLNDKMCSIKTSTTSAVPTSGVSTHYEDNLLDIIADKENVIMSLKYERRRIMLIEKGLMSLPDDKRRILEMFYIERRHNHVSVLCAELNVEATTIYRLKDEALRQFALEQYGVEY